VTRLVEVLGTVLGVYAHGGDDAKFLEVTQEALAGAEQSGERVYLFLYVQRAFAKSRLGDAKAALAELRRAKESNLGDIEHQFYADWLVAAEAEIALSAGHPEEAIALAEKAVAIARRARTLYGAGCAERVWGLALARLDPPRHAQADLHFAASLEFFQEADVRLDAARTRMAWGKTWMQRGDRARAREHFERAAAQFQVSGLLGELEHAQEMIESASM
jgi:tetratricopeptide (TPR) repeat protein